MYYEQDYIMRLIKQVIRALIGILLNKKTAMEYDMPVNRQQTSSEDFLVRLILLRMPEKSAKQKMSYRMFWKADRILPVRLR